ncbi:RING-H2 finger protein ATL16-like [Hevea brasiliensis]|uniref:RING-H2 finger protein ATL16-like n=1 Tax=Hevea brasiliensis TaxID=3981 RepID=UPI0025D5333C|nr:RING-H2 finger protein ATL16-like [Hevea brasiliensis]
MPLSPTPAAQHQLENSPEWNPYVIGPVVAVCTFIVMFSYYRILKRLCCSLNTLTFSRNRFQMRRIGENSLGDSSLQYYSHGLESAIMCSLPISQFKKEKEEESRTSNSECAVCLGEFEEGEWLKHLPICAHVFHVACIDTWFQTRSNCPLCRSQVYDLSHEYSISMSILLETLRREDFLHERAKHYQILRPEILGNPAPATEEIGAGLVSSR